MMKVPVRISPSKIQGLGIFAVAPIKAGTLLWKYEEPVDYRITGMCRASPAWEEHFRRYTYKPAGADFIVVCGDAGMFWNHSDAPNCTEATSVAGEDMTFAAFDIEAGEELVIDYRQIESRPMPWLEPKERSG